MKGSFILEIPGFARLLQLDTIMEWQLYGLGKTGGYRKVQWEVKQSGICTEIIGQKRRHSGPSAKVDFTARQIIFCQGELSDGEFTEFLLFLLNQSYLRVRDDQMHFIGNPQKKLQRTFQEES